METGGCTDSSIWVSHILQRSGKRAQTVQQSSIRLKRTRSNRLHLVLLEVLKSSENGLLKRAYSEPMTEKEKLYDPEKTNVS